jgi:SAM-dependent methyltransferase
LALMTDSLHGRFYADETYDGTRRFYRWVREHTGPSARLLNLGAGPATGNPIRTLKGEVAEVVGADISPVVLTNPELDSAVLIADGRLPFEAARFDLVLSDYVLEHVEHPETFMSEVYRVLKPGRSFFFRTPNIYHYVALISAATPLWFHHCIANRVRANLEHAQEPWPTFYRLNSRRTLTARANAAGFSRIELHMIETEPAYLRFHALPFLVGVAYERLVNSSEAFAGMRANIFGRLVK